MPPGQAKKWSKHCGRYNACGRPVYFVKVNGDDSFERVQYRQRMERNEIKEHMYKKEKHNDNGNLNGNSNGKRKGDN